MADRCFTSSKISMFEISSPFNCRKFPSERPMAYGLTILSKSVKVSAGLPLKTCVLSRCRACLWLHLVGLHLCWREFRVKQWILRHSRLFCVPVLTTPNLFNSIYLWRLTSSWQNTFGRDIRHGVQYSKTYRSTSTSLDFLGFSEIFLCKILSFVLRSKSVPTLLYNDYLTRNKNLNFQ